MNGAESIDYRGALEAVERILNRGGDADDVLRAVLEALQARRVASAKVQFAENGRLVDGPSFGGEAEQVVAPVVPKARRSARARWLHAIAPSSSGSRP